MINQSPRVVRISGCESLLSPLKSLLESLKVKSSPSQTLDMLVDIQGLDVSTDSPELIVVLNEFIQQILGYIGASSHVLCEVADKDTSSIMIHSMCAFMKLERENSKDFKVNLRRAKDHIDKARSLLGKATEREKLYFRITEYQYRREEGRLEDVEGGYDSSSELDDSMVKNVSNRIYPEASHEEDVQRRIYDRILDLLNEIVRRWPDDYLGVKFAQLLHFNLGDSLGMLRVAQYAMEHSRDDHPLRYFLYGMTAFGIIETAKDSGQIEEAERLGRLGTRLAPDMKDAWSHHAVAHCMEVTGRLDEGIRWMEGKSSLWEDCNSFMYTHNWWHTALFYLDRGSDDKAVALFDDRVWGKTKDGAQDQIGAASLLWRMDMKDSSSKYDFKSRWEDIADHVEPHIREHVQPLLDLHYLYTLARAGRSERVDEMLSSLEHSAKYGRDQKNVALPLARGIVAHATGRFDESFELMSTVMPRLKEVGGSDAQLDIFGMTYLDVLLKSNRYDIAKPLIEDRAKHRPRTPHCLFQLSETLAGIGKSKEATLVSLSAIETERYYKSHSP